MKTERMLRVEEVAVLLNVSTKTINNWYWFKRENPDNPLSKLLPDYEQTRPTGARLWKFSDLDKFGEFRDNVVVGRKGVMGNVTQKYVQKGE